MVAVLLAGCMGGGSGGGDSPAAGGDGGAAATPSTSFEATQEEVMYKDRDFRDWCGDAPANADEDARVGGACFNGTEVVISHAGGDSLSSSQTELLVNGNASVWGTTNPASDAAGTGETAWDIDTQEHVVQPQPNFFEAEPFGAGDAWRVSAYGGPIEDRKNWHNSVWPDAKVNPGPYWVSFKADKHREDLWAIRPRDETEDMTPHKVNANTLATGDEIEVVWAAASGDEQATLFTHTVE
jgi:hypothetical protein